MQSSSSKVPSVPARAAAAAIRRVRDPATAGGEQPGEIGALIDLLSTIDAAHVAAVSLADRVESRDLAPRRTGPSLEGLLAFQARMTTGDRRMLLNVGALLRRMPHLRRQDPDTVLDEVRDDVSRLRPDLERDREVRDIEHRFLHVQPALDGALTGYVVLDAEAGATVLAGLEAAMPALSAGRRDVTADALGEATPDRRGSSDTGDGADQALPDPSLAVSRARQRADGLVRLAESFLSGGSGTARARPRLNVVTDLATLFGEDELAGRSSLLWVTAGRRPSLTPEAVRRLASDADLRHILVDGASVLGVAEPTPSIPRAVREAVLTRDQGCRFPGCRVPIQWLDMHHVQGRAEEGHTVVSNLVAVCRRHHVGVTEGQSPRLTRLPARRTIRSACLRGRGGASACVRTDPAVSPPRARPGRPRSGRGPRR